jgi:hypothetical protein
VICKYCPEETKELLQCGLETTLREKKRKRRRMTTRTFTTSYELLHERKGKLQLEQLHSYM